MSSGPKNTTTTTKVELPPEVQAMMSQYMGGTTDLFNSGFNPVAAITPEQQYAVASGLAGYQNLQGDTDVSRGLLNGVVAGDYLSPDSNPYFSGTVDAALGKITDQYMRATAPNTDNSFAKAGNWGGSAWREATDTNQKALADQLATTANQMYSNNYANERANQMAASTALPGLDITNLQGAQSLLGLGTSWQDLLQAQQNAPLAQLGILQQALQTGMGTAGQSSTQPNPNYRSPLQNLALVGSLFL